MPDPFNFHDGTLHVWTGAATASGSPLAFVQGSRFDPTWGWQSDPALNGVYRDHLTGQRADITLEMVTTFDQTLARIAQSATAVHFKFTHSSLDGSAGYIAYSGHIDSIHYLGTDGAPYTYRLQAHTHTWSAF